ncbi:MAG TPA: hypothetical protein VMX17_09440 [Candidatus Glassbacteria bacterium]|nr:hypothetical protein [Candidatus Glassbacteria bacterium]
MNLRSNDILEILTNNFGFKRTKTPLGEGCEVTCKEGFLFSSITGAGYLENQIYPFSPKGLLKVFYSACQYKFVTGIFDNSSLRNTPYIMSKARDYLFDGNKIIVPVEFMTDQELRGRLIAAFGENGKNTDLILLRIEAYKEGGGLEPFMEYLTCKYFNQLGFITENQIPLSHTSGSPDFGGFGVKRILNAFNKFQVLPHGFNILELSLIRIFRDRYGTFPYSSNDIIVGEAKTASSQSCKQIMKYLDTGFFNYAFEIHSEKTRLSNDAFGLLILKDKKIEYMNPKLPKDFSNKKLQNNYRKWLENYFKFYLFSNFTNDELQHFSQREIGKTIDNQSDITGLAESISIEYLMENILYLIDHGTFK